MRLVEKILNLRKECKLSQEVLAEKVNVTRQTISNWELGETLPNSEQLKLLSSVFNVSIDELLDNDIKNVLTKKISNTEKTASLILKILKVIGVIVLVFLFLLVLSLILFNVGKKDVVIEKNQTIQLKCSLDGKNYSYVIESNKDDNIIDASGSEYIVSIIQDKKFKKGKVLVRYIESYFEDNGGHC